MSGSTEYALPFRRGSTYKDGSTLTLSSTVGEAIVGRVYKTTDSNGKDLWLRAVRADAALTNVGGKPVSYTSGALGKNVDALTDADGEICSIVDDAYATTFDVEQYDIFYVVEQGDVDAACETDVNAAGINLMCDASGDNIKTATAGYYIVAVSNEAVSDGIANVHVFGGLKPSDPAS